ncbi:hypothetical protein Q5O14_03295 [Eubacteriaceae bacterium ES2]|nr:hypothetical protein Q5O14_03295 [Eubacteriaceae bacterium ES2]
MNLPQDIIYFQLQKHFSLRYLKKNNQNLLYSRPVFFEVDMSQTGQTILINDDNLLQLQSDSLADSLIILRQAPSFDLTYIDATILLVEEETSIQTLFNALQKIFNLFDDWDTQLNHSLFNGGSFQDLVNICDLVMDERILLVDHKFHYAAFSQSCELMFDDTVIDEHYNMPIDAVNDFISDQKFQALYDEQEIFLYESTTPDGMDQMLCRNFFNQTAYAGRLIVILIQGSNESTKAYVSAILDHLFVYSNLLFDKYQSLDIKQVVLNNMREPLINILNNLPNPVGQWERLALDNGWQENDRLQLIQFSSKASYTKIFTANFWAQKSNLNGRDASRFFLMKDCCC